MAQKNDGSHLVLTLLVQQYEKKASRASTVHPLYIKSEKQSGRTNVMKY